MIAIILYGERIFAFVYRFSLNWIILFGRKQIVCTRSLIQISKMSDMEHRAVIKFFTPKDLTATEIHRELNNVYKHFVLSYCTVTKWGDEFKDPQCGFEDSPRSACPSTTVTDENILSHSTYGNA